MISLERKTSLVLLAGICFLFTGCQGEQLTSEPVVVGYVTNSNGFAMVNRDNQKYILARQSRIYVADIFYTDKSSRLEMTLLDNTIISLGYRSHLVLNRFVPGKTSSTGLTLVKGALQTRMGTPGNLELQTPLAVVQLRGADIYASFVSGILEVAMTNNGIVMVSNDNGEVTINRTDFGTNVIAGSAPGTPFAWAPRRLQRVIEDTTVHPSV